MYKQSYVEPVDNRGSSSVIGVTHLCNQLPALFKKYNIKKIFDAGANDAAWQIQTLSHMVEYHAGEHNADIVSKAKLKNPELSIRQHNVTTDLLPAVDLLFVRDVAIHMNNFYKKQLLTNWLSSSIPWLLITQMSNTKINYDSDQTDKFHDESVVRPEHWYFAEINWQLHPWNFPCPMDKVEDGEQITSKPIERFMYLWHQDQLKGLAWQWPA